MNRTFFLFGAMILLLITGCSNNGFNGRKVFFGTPDGYSERLSAAIEQAGGIPVSVPLIETIIPSSNRMMDSLLAGISSYDWIAFSSRKAIESFFMAAERNGTDTSLLASAKFCAMGRDAELLREYGYSCAIEPTEASPAGITAALATLPDITGQRIAVIVPGVTGLTEPPVVPDFIAGLEAAGLVVTRVDGYKTRPVIRDDKLKQANMVASGYYDVIAFTSTAEAEAFLNMMEGYLLKEDQLFACFGPYTAANVRSMGLLVEIVSDDFSSFDGFAEAIKNYFLSSSRPSAYRAKRPEPAG
ncbi:MAG: uroporphyrinogen-III synthase [Bacteroidales bacterium]|nr:uroporphyrinogen-III synthase [Bacteroidales bacterium]